MHACRSTLEDPTPSNPADRSPVRRIIELALAAVMLIAVFSEGRFLLISSMGRRAEARGDIDLAFKNYVAAEGEWFSRDMYLGAASIPLAGGGDGNLDSAQKLLDRYLDQNAEDARAWKLGGDIARARGTLAEALRRYDKAWELGRFNYIVITSEIIRTLEAMGDRGEIDRRKPGFDAVHAAFGSAILRNAHFIDLSDNVEEFERVSAMLARLYPADAGKYLDLSERAVTHAKEVREELGDTKRGMLW